MTDKEKHEYEIAKLNAIGELRDFVNMYFVCSWRGHEWGRKNPLSPSGNYPQFKDVTSFQFCLRCHKLNLNKREEND